MNDRIALSLSPSGGNATRTIRITHEVLEFHVDRAHEIRAERVRHWVAQARVALFGRAAARRQAVDCADSAWLARS